MSRIPATHVRDFHSRRRQPSFRRGSVVIYAFFLLIILFSMLSLAVDFRRMETFKTQLQRAADATARGALQMYVYDGSANAFAYAPTLATTPYNPVDAGSGIQPTVSVVWGWWDAAGKKFYAGSGTPLAVSVTLFRTKANNNPVPLTFPLFNGLSAVRTTCDVWATAVAVLQPTVTTTKTVNGTADLWLSNMPAGSNAGWTDNPNNAPPVMAINVSPGSIVNFTATGQTMNKGPTATIGADGASNNTTHMAGSPDGNYNGLQNGIQTLTAPQNALIGVFLTEAAPNTQTPPAAGLDQSSSTAQNQSNFTGALLQQPFFIGDGKNTSNITQQFVVPAGATRLYLGVFDGWQNNDNPGSLSVTTTQQAFVYLVK